jgi:phage replication O-like protein O
MNSPTENKKPKEGFTIISHELYEWAMASGLSKQELNIIHAIIRQTNGWNQRKEAPISNRLFGEMTNTHHWNASKVIKKLLEKELILRRPGEKMKYGKPVYYYRLNKHLCRLQNASQENCRTVDASTAVNSTPQPAVNNTAIKETNKIYKNQNLVDKCKNFVLHYADKESSSNENQKDDPKTENCGSKEK